MLKLTDEQKDTLSYDDVAYLILTDTKKKCKIQKLFKMVIELMELSENTFEDQIGEFFELIVTDKRFTMLDDGYVDLKINHKSKVIIEDDDEEELALEEEQDTESEEYDEEENYDDESNPEDDGDDDLQDLVIIDSDSEDIESELM